MMLFQERGKEDFTLTNVFVIIYTNVTLKTNCSYREVPRTAGDEATPPASQTLFISCVKSHWSLAA